MSTNDTTTLWWEQLPTWRGYPIGLTQHPTRPWWRGLGNTHEACVAERTDRARLKRGRWPPLANDRGNCASEDCHGHRRKRG